MGFFCNIGWHTWRYSSAGLMRKCNECQIVEKWENYVSRKDGYEHTRWKKTDPRPFFGERW